MSTQTFGRSPKALIQSQYEEAYKKELERILKYYQKKAKFNKKNRANCY